MTRYIGRLTAGIWLIAGTIPAGAHPGHGEGSSGAEHYLTEPIHALGLWGSIAVAAGALLAWAATSKRRIGQQSHRD